MNPPDRMDNPIQVMLGHLRTGRKTQAPLEQILADTPAHDTRSIPPAAGSRHLGPSPRRLPIDPGPWPLAVTFKHGLQVHRLPEGAGFDAPGLQRQAESFAVRAEFMGVNEDDRQPPRASAVRGFRHEVDTRKISEGLPVVFENRSNQLILFTIVLRDLPQNFIPSHGLVAE